MQRPRGVTILATLAIILSALNLLNGILLIAGVIPFEKAMGQVPDMGELQASFEQTVKVLLVLVSLLALVVGVNLLRMKNWARRVTRALSVLGLLGALVQMIQEFATKNAPGFLFCAVVGGAYYWAFYYLGQDHVRTAFASPGPGDPAPSPPSSAGPSSAG